MRDSLQNGWTIRPANSDDWEQIARISTSIADEGLVGNYINEIGPKYLNVGRTFVVEGTNIVAFHNIQDVPDGSIYLSGLRVLREYRKKGIAMALIQSAMKQATLNGKKMARAFVEPENKASMALFSKAGFAIKEQLYLYFGSVNIDGFEEESEWPDSILDIGHLPAAYFKGIPARLLRKEGCLIAISERNRWDNLPSFTLLNPKGCPYVYGESFMVSREELDQESMEPLRRIRGFETANLMEALL